MASWHLEVRAELDDSVLCSADVTAKKVGDIEGVVSADFVGILLERETVATGFLTQEQALDGRFKLLRWPADAVDGDPIVTDLPRHGH